MNMKSCSNPKCAQINPQPLERFSKRNGIGDGYQGRCKVCANAAKLIWYNKNIEIQRANTRAYAAKNREKVKESTKRWTRENPEKVKSYYLKKRYGITLEWYEQTLKDQNHACAICLKPSSFKIKSLYVDHCHETGKIRGLLCMRCNATLGYSDSIARLESAIAYLKKHS